MSKQNSYLVSVIIPTYNRAEELKRAMKSVLNQTYRNLELIIIDDGSIDDTENTVQFFSDDRIKYLRNDENMGVAHSRNRGLAIARGNYVSFLDSDDEWLEDKLDVQLEKATEFNKPVFIFSNGYCDAFDKRFAWDRDIPSGTFMYQKNSHPLKQAIPPPSCWFISRSIFDKIGEFDTNLTMWEDQDFILRMFLEGITVYFLNKLLVRWHQGSDNLSTLNAKLMESKEYFLEKHNRNMEEDSEYLFRFLCSMGKDFLKIKEKKKARQYYIKAFKMSPGNLRVLTKIFKTII